MLAVTSEKLHAVSSSEMSRRHAVWEIFTNECTFLLDHLMVLKHVSLIFTWLHQVFPIRKLRDFQNQC